MSLFRPLPSPPRLDWLQVEISTLCNGACLYCPRTLYARQWQNRLMSQTLFERLVPVFKTTNLVYLQGWGEPLTHPDFFALARMAKSCGCQVGTTTNGTLLTEERCRQMVDAEVDIVGFSLAGVEASNDRIRVGTSFAQVVQAIHTLNRLKHQRGSDKPAIHIAYLLLRSRLADLRLLPPVFSRLQVQQVVVSTLDLIAEPELAGEALVPANSEEEDELAGHFQAMVTAGKQLDLPIHAWLAATSRPPGAVDGNNRPAPLSFYSAAHGCTEHLHRAAFVAADGGVSPCVYANLPLNGPASHWPKGRPTPWKPLVFGHISQRSFASIWHGSDYSTFRKFHGLEQPPQPCQDCVRLRMHAFE